jgi:hypothetical protein
MSLKHGKIALKLSAQSCDDGFGVKPKTFKVEFAHTANGAAQFKEPMAFFWLNSSRVINLCSRRVAVSWSRSRSSRSTVFMKARNVIAGSDFSAYSLVSGCLRSGWSRVRLSRAPGKENCSSLTISEGEICMGVKFCYASGRQKRMGEAVAWHHLTEQPNGCQLFDDGHCRDRQRSRFRTPIDLRALTAKCRRPC